MYAHSAVGGTALSKMLHIDSYGVLHIDSYGVFHIDPYGVSRLVFGRDLRSCNQF